MKTYPYTLTDRDAVSYAESVYIGSVEHAPLGNLALIAAIKEQDTSADVSVDIYNAFN